MGWIGIGGKVNTVKSKFKWVIDNFSKCDSDVGDYLQSSIFTTTSDNSQIQWYLELFPKGRNEGSKDYVSLFLHSTPKPYKADATFQILNNKGEIVWTFSMTEMTFDKNGKGCALFILRKIVLDPANYILDDDKMTIVFQINHEEEQKYKVLQRLAEIDKYEALIGNDKYSDVTLISEGKSIKVLKCILAKSSPVFAAMFDADMKEKENNIVEIEDIAHDVLLEIIRFAYAGKVNNIDTIAGELAAAADKYAMDGLKEMCEWTMLTNLSKDNVLFCLALADKHRMDKLKEMGITFIVDNAVDVTNKPEFKLLPSILLCDLCRALKLRK